MPPSNAYDPDTTVHVWLSATANVGQWVISKVSDRNWVNSYSECPLRPHVVSFRFQQFSASLALADAQSTSHNPLNRAFNGVTYFITYFARHFSSNLRTLGSFKAKRLIGSSLRLTNTHFDSFTLNVARSRQEIVMQPTMSRSSCESVERRVVSVCGGSDRRLSSTRATYVRSTLSSLTRQS